MKKIYFLLIFILISCKEPRSCTNAKLNNRIMLLGFHKLDIKKNDVFFYEIIEKKTYRNIEVKNVIKGKYLEIELEEHLFSKNKYKLILNSSLDYEITDIKIRSEIRMLGIREDSTCIVESFIVNGKKADMIFSSGINFRRP